MRVKSEAPKGENDKNWIRKKTSAYLNQLNFGDDKDRALQKSDNSWTYFASDVAYHNNKLE